MAGLRQDKLFQFQLDPGEPEPAAGGVGEVGGQALQQLARDPTGFQLKNLAEAMIIDCFFEIIPGGCPGHRWNGKDNGAENRLLFAALGFGHTEMAGEPKINDGERGGHGILE